MRKSYGTNNAGNEYLKSKIAYFVTIVRSLTRTFTQVDPYSQEKVYEIPLEKSITEASISKHLIYTIDINSNVNKKLGYFT